MSDDDEKTFGNTGYTIDQAAEIMGHVIDEMIEGGSFRNFIYGRLGFDEAAYVPMFNAGVMEFTNACPVNMQKEYAPQFAHAGVHTIIGVSEDHKSVEVEYASWYDGKMRKDTVINEFEWWKPSVGEMALVVYYSTATSGLHYALPASVMWAAHRLGEDMKNPEKPAYA